MLINGYTLTQFQRCKRPHAISRTHTLSKWRPQSLLAMCLRYAVFHMSNGKPKDDVVSTAVSHFLHAAKSPGLDVYGVDTYTLAMDYCSIIKNFLEYLSRLTLLSLREMPPANLAMGVDWQFLSHKDESGVLHRWKFVDYIPDNFAADCHSWEVFGDIAAADMPMELHMVAIGQRNQSHQVSPWCRIFAHPSLANVFRFQKKKGGLEGDWKPVYFSSSSKNNPKDWVDMMLRDNAIEGLIRHVSIKEVSDKHKDLFLRDVLAESGDMVKYWDASPRDIPMSRYACDHPYECPHQLFCYDTALTLDSAGIYSKRNKEVTNAEMVTA